MVVAEYIASALFRSGVRYIFGVPGGSSIPYIEAFRAAGIEFVLTSHEASAGIMAGVTARLTGVTGVCHATTGPGATNITTGCGVALLDRLPVVVLTCETDSAMINRTTQMNINHQELFKPITKATFRLTPQHTAEVVEMALKKCREEYPGPVHLGLPADIASQEALTIQPAAKQKKEEIVSNDTDIIFNILNNTKKPLIAAGLTLARLSAGQKLITFLTQAEIPVVLTPMAKGVIPENHPCYAGVLFHALSEYLDDIVEKCDLIIGLGYDPVEYNYESWMPDVPLLHFNTRWTDLPENIKSAQFIGPPEEWFSVLRKAAWPPRLSIPEEITKVREEVTRVFQGFTGHFGPVTALRVLQEEIPPETIVTADVGSHLHLIGQFWNTSGRQKILMTNGWSGMGFGIPAALAACMINPFKPVVCITGDGGFLMTAGEIATARRYNLPVIIVVLSDGELNLIRLKKSWQNKSPYGTILYSGDLFGSDRFLGIRVLAAGCEDELRKAVRTSFALSEPVIIDARIEPDDYKWLIKRTEAPELT